MAFKFQTQPLCRYCGRPIAKYTERFRFGPDHRSIGDDARTDIKPRSKVEAQRHINGQIVSVHWTMKRKSNDWRDVDYDEQERAYISAVTAWDGESYVDPFFCNGDHAKRFAYAAARLTKPFISMPAYDVAMKVRAKP